MRTVLRAAATALLLLCTLFLTTPPAKAQVTGTDLTTMKALASLPNWSQATTWDPNTNPCPASGSANWAGVTCNRQGRVVIIVAVCSSTLINGQIPGTLLSQLTALTSFDLRNCGMWGPIPDAMQTMTQITRLRLDNNALTGQIPSWLATLPNLGYLDLTGNRLTGPIPAFPAIASTIIRLSSNLLSGDIPTSWSAFNRIIAYNFFNTPFPASCTNASSTNQCGPNKSASAPTVTVTKVSGDGQWTQTGSTFANPLAVTVTDLSNNPVAGATVTFSGPGITTTTATTDNNGLASTTVTASSTVGGNTVTAAVGLTGMTTFGLTAGDLQACNGNIQVTSNGDTGAGTLREALSDVCPGGTVDLTPIAGQTIALSASATSYNFSGRLYIGDDVTIAGHGVTISGSGNTRLFFIQGGNVSMSNLTLTDGLGQGGSSQYGGPAAGMGGAIFQNGGALTLTSVVFSNNTAQGGTTDTSGLYTGGGFGANSSGGDLGGGNGAGDGAGGLQDGLGDPGGFGGGGGYGNSGISGTVADGGIGGFGAAMGRTDLYIGFTMNAQNLNNPFANGYGAVLGGAAGFGGAIFTRSGTLNLISDTFSANSAVGASGAQGKGGSLFIYNGASYNLDSATTFTGSVAAAAGAAGLGFSDLVYATGNTCPGADTTDLCGVASNYTLAGPSSAAYQSTFQVTPASNNTVTPTLSILSGPCSLSGTTVSVTGASGACVVQASWAANGIYPASTATRTVNVTPASAASACVAPLATLTAWYKAEGNANDVTGAFNGTAAGDVSYAAGGKVGQAFSFDGTQSPSVALPAAAFPATQTAFSFETWFRTSGETGGVILGHQDQPAYTTPTSHTPAIYVGTNGKLYVQALYSNSTQFAQSVSSYPVNDSQWHHVAVTFDGSNQISYLDGVAFGSQTIGSGAQLDPYYQLGTGYTYGWQEGNGGWYTFNGLIDEATVYSAVLQPSDILNIISAGTYGKCNAPKSFTATVGTNQPGTSFSVDGNTYTSTQQFTWNINSQHTIATTATQAGSTGTQYVFSGWSDSGALSHNVTFTAATTYTANFQTQYLLTTAASPAAGGTVTASGYFNSGTSPTVTATPAANYVFGSWSGPAISSGAQSSVLMSAPESLTANFLQTQSITFTAISTQVLGTPLTLSATATSGLTVSYQSTTQTVCTVNGSSVTFLTSGSCSLTASQAGNTSYAAAAAVTQTFTVAATPVTPSVPNNGVFPATSVGVTSTAVTFTFTFNTTETLAATPYVVLTQGALNLDFQAASTQPSTVCTGGQTYNSGDSCTVNVTFTPTKPYQRMGAVQLMGSGGTPIATFNLVGTGTGAQVIFPGNSAVTTLPNGSGFNLPTGVAVDGSGNVFVADYNNSAVKEILAVNGVVSSTSSVITVGSGFSYPYSVAVDGSGNVFVADFNNRAVKEIQAVNGVVSSTSSVITVASGFSYPFGVAVDGSGNVFIADTNNSAVKEILAVNGVVSSTSSVITLGSGFSYPRGVAVDGSGNVFVADFNNNAVKEILAVNGVVSSTSSVITLGSGFSKPTGVAVDGSGNVFVADFNNRAVKEILAVNGAVSSSSSVITLGSGFSYTYGVAVDSSGNVFVADTSNNAVKEINRATPPALNFASTNVNSTSSDSPQSVTVQNSGNASLLESALTIGTNFTQVAGSGTPADCTASTTLMPGASCNLSISFKPTTGGPLSAFAVLSNNAPTSPQSISLSGTGVVPPSTLSVTITPNGSFTQGQTAEWDVQVSNLAPSATNATSGTTTLVDTLPTGYTLSSFVGTGWNCLAVTTNVTCTSTQVVAGASGAFSKLQLIVNVPATSVNSVTDNVSVYGGGDPNHTSLGTAATSFSTVSVVQTAGPVVITNPISQTVTAGSNASFTAAASGTPTPTVQWQLSTDGGSIFSNIAGATSTTLSLTSVPAFANASQYRAVFTNSTGSATTTAATLTVNAGPAVITNPINQTVTAGGNVSFTAAASGTPTPTVQWQISTDSGSTFSNIAGATLPTLSFAATSGANGSMYRAVFTNTTGSATTTAATLTVNAGPAVITNPASQTVTAGSNVSFSAAASGTPTPTVQWQVSTDSGSTFSNIAGATSTTLNLTAVAASANGYQYRAVFTNSTGSATTTAATLTVNAGPAVITNPTNQTVTAGSNVSFTAAASGTPTPTVQWQISTDSGSTFSNIAGATLPTLSFAATSGANGSMYRAVFTNTTGSATTTAATLTVNAGPAVITNPASQTVTAGSNVSFSAAASGTPTPTVQWQVSTDSGGTFSNIAGATSTTLNLTAVAASANGYQYRAVFTNSTGSATTTAATLTVNAGPAVITNPINQTVTAGSNVSFTAAASGTPTPTVQWQVSIDSGSTFGNIAGATATTLNLTALVASANGYQYRAVFTNTTGSATTTAATLTVNAGPAVITNPTSQTVTAGSNVSFSAAASGTPTPTVQWQVSTDGGSTFSNIAGATATTLNLTAAAASANGYQYRAVFTNTTGSATTTAATLTVNAGPAVITNPTSQTVTAGSNVSFSAAASGTPNPTVQWQVSTDGGSTFSNIAGATLPTLSFAATSGANGSKYHAVFTNTTGSATTTAATLTVNVGPLVITNPTSQTVTAGGNVSFTAAASGTPTPTVQWQVSTDSGSTFSNIPGATSPTLSFVATLAANSSKYRAVFTNTAGSATTTAATLTVNPNIPTISNLQAVSVGGNSEVISWTTDQPSTTQVTYGANSTPLDNNLVTYHSVTLTSLSANTTYNYDVSSTNSTNGTATSPNSTFTTTPYVGYVAFWGVNNSGVTISWSTDTAATTFVAYGTTTALGQTTPVQTSLSNGHGVVLTGLNPGTTYYFSAESTDTNGHTGASTVYTFTTTGQPASPAPVITNVTVSGITTTGATITWTTDQASTTQVNYGATTSYGSSSPLNSSLLTSHSVTLSNLTPGTTYNYDVISTNSSGTSSGMSTNYTFQTTAVIATPPAISNIQSSVTSTTATVTWTTDQAANSSVNYVTAATTPDSSYVTSHSVTLTNLTPGTLYNFTVISTNAAGLTTTSQTGTFTTTASNATAPYVGYVAAWGINNSGATVSWSTDVPADAQLNYGTSANLGTLSPLQPALTNSHGVVLTNLASGTTYYFVAQSKGANGATGYSTVYTFTTSGSPSAPAPNISNIQTSVTTNSATITWTTDQAASTQVNYGVTTTYSASSTLDPTLSTTHSVTLTNLMPGTTYNFDVVSSNVNSLSATSSNSTFQTTGSAPGPVISSVSASSITSSTALITWTTDQAATSVVKYGNQTVSDPTLVTSHSVPLSGLSPNTLYSYTVTSVNAASVSATSSSFSFTTAAQSASAPVISFVAFWGVTSSGVTISWSTNVPSNTAVNYGKTNALGTVTPLQTALTNSHGVTLMGLEPGTTYYFQTQSADVNGNTGYSPTTYTFTTLAGGTPIISNLLVTPANNNTATISWTTSIPTYSYIQYGPSSGNYNRYSAQTSLTTAPNCVLGYVPSGTVHYQLVSTDANGNQVVSPDATFVEP